MITSGLCPDVVLLGKFGVGDDVIALATKVQRQNECRIILLLDSDKKASPRIAATRFPAIRKPLRLSHVVQEITRVVAEKPAASNRPFLVGRERS
jgi:hypothetical protein